MTDHPVSAQEPEPELSIKRKFRLETLIARALHPYVCTREDPMIPTCLQRARAVLQEWEDEVSR